MLKIFFRKHITLSIATVILLSFGLGVCVTTPYNNKIKKDVHTELKALTSTPYTSPTNKTSTIFQWNGGSKIISEISGTNQTISLLDVVDPSSPSAQSNKVHLLDVGLCSQLEKVVYSEILERVILYSSGCGDGQTYYLLSLTKPFVIQPLILPYSFSNYVSTPVDFIDKDSLLFKKISDSTDNSVTTSTTEYYVSNLNKKNEYKRVFLPE